VSNLPAPPEASNSVPPPAAAAGAAPPAGGMASMSDGASVPLVARERVIAGLWIGLAALLALLLFYLLAPILTPFALAAVLAYLLLPGANWLFRHRVPRWLASLLMVLLSGAIAMGLILILVPVLEREAIALDERLPSLIALLNDRLAPLLHQWLGLRLRFDPAVLRSMAMQHVGQQDFISNLFERFSSGGLAVLGLIGTLVLIPVVLFYLLLDAAPFTQRFESSLPRRWHAPTMQFLAEIDAVLSQFLRGQLTVMLLLSLYYCTALSLAGFESALPIGMLTGLLIFIPYAGYGLGLLLASVVALLQFPPLQAGISLAVVYGLGQVLEGFILTPRLVGQRIGLHPLAVIFALLAFAQVFGFFGVLVALPASAVLLVALRRVRTAYLASDFYGRP